VIVLVGSHRGYLGARTELLDHYEEVTQENQYLFYVGEGSIFFAHMEMPHRLRGRRVDKAYIHESVWAHSNYEARHEAIRLLSYTEK